MEVMDMNIEVGFYNLWRILLIVIVFAGVLMLIGNKLRGMKIENPEDHYNPKVNTVGSLPLLVLLVISIFTPIIMGALFWTGCVLIAIAGIIYVLTIIAFIKARKGLTTIGVYQISRNPMYIAWFLVFIAFTLLAWQADLIMGISTAFITLLNIFVIHWMVLGEERFLSKKYGDAYREYMNRTPRYVGIPKKKL